MSPILASLALAYVDPSTGGLLFQLFGLVFATISGVFFFFSRQLKATLARARRFVNERLARS